jgi:hypothetical protein
VAKLAGFHFVAEGGAKPSVQSARSNLHCGFSKCLVAENDPHHHEDSMGNKDKRKEKKKPKQPKEKPKTPAPSKYGILPPQK